MLIPFDYLIDKYKLKVNGILHLGASTGQEAETYNSMDVKRVYWVEANYKIFEELRDNLRKYPRQIPIHACISNENEETDFHISNNGSQSSSILELGTHTIIHPEVHYVDKIRIKSTRIDSLFNLLDVDTSMLDFLNIDLQGAELMALEGMGDMLKQFNYVYTEINKKETYIGCAMIDDLDYFLMKNGFLRVETGNWVADTWTDAFYIKEEFLHD